MRRPRVAIVTGATRGLGRGIAKRLLQADYAVALVDIDSSVHETARALDNEGSRSLSLVADVSDPDACERVAAEVADRFASIDALVNNAGVGGPSTAVHETDPAAFRRVLEVNLVGPFLMTRAVVPLMIATAEHGAIVNITSVLGQRAESGAGAYSASKGGLTLLSQSMALELAVHGIRVNSVAPGNMLTDMHAEHVEGLATLGGVTYSEALDGVRATVPLGRHGTPDDIGSVVTWLLTPDSGYVTGQTVAVNGGILLT